MDPRIYVTAALFREMRGASELITSRLPAAGFDDIPGEAALLLAVTDVSRHHPSDLMPKLGISEQDAGQMIDTLAAHGYLKRSADRDGNGWDNDGRGGTRQDEDGRDEDGRDDDGQPRVAITGRGRALVHVIMDGLGVARWAGFEPRHGDIVVSTPPESGSGLMQVVCALLVFQTPDFPAPMHELSVWPEASRDAWTRLAAQEHRRLIRTRLPLGELPWHAEVTYLAVARDPLDVAVALQAGRPVPGGGQRRPPGHSGPPGQAGPPGRDGPGAPPHDWLLRWIDADEEPQVRRDSLAGLLDQLSQAWARRDAPNVMLAHYEDLRADLDGQMRQLAARLGITVPDARWPGLVKAAAERAHSPSHRIPPGADLADGPAGGDGTAAAEAGRGLLSADEVAHYQERATRLAPAALLAWLERRGQPT